MAAMLSNPHLVQSFANFMSALSAPPQPQQMPQQIQMPAQATGFTLPPHLFTTLPDVYKHNEPVGTSPNDEELLVNALHAAKSANITYRRALDEMHGVNNHAANLWKDYYLEHTDRLEARVKRLSEGAASNAVRVKKPSHFQQSASAPAPAPPTRNGEAQQKKVRIDDRDTEPSSSKSHTPRPSQPSAPRRAPRPSLPRAPSHEPTPPKNVVPGARGNAFTPEDKQYFLDYITWELKCDPSIQRKDLVRGLGQKAPHHSKDSWGNYWMRHDLADRILAAAQRGSLPESDHEGEDDEEGEDASADERRREELRARSVDISQYLGDADDDATLEELVRDMGDRGERYTPADFRAMAKHVVSHKNWDELTSKQRWFPFHEIYPQRSCSAWTEAYRKREAEILKLADKYRRDEERDANESIPPQHGRPSWSSDRVRRPSQKRKTPP
ncbi:hypothetical protein BV25DRAFT_1829529 [Artomyces pyxidatus]|uniref:Uncharacterized protein n=1 Tax=Artomyces pyxidatus TaxID=48021 RepID=A0ACB8SQW0_9AGAM|nr:hypothetical protein BV25DRAFT_1829529 [Artomyces pyxidatus]